MGTRGIRRKQDGGTVYAAKVVAHVCSGATTERGRDQSASEDKALVANAPLHGDAIIA